MGCCCALSHWYLRVKDIIPAWQCCGSPLKSSLWCCCSFPRFLCLTELLPGPFFSLFFLFLRQFLLPHPAEVCAFSPN